ncbi:hypothetical protein HDU82_002432 [Entophlyctis luteolus]|nr:hypothetical protein HDU82_002432 [Entophlyctis luteolus]
MNLEFRASKSFAVGVVFLGVFADITVYSVIIPSRNPLSDNLKSHPFCVPNPMPVIPFILESIGESETWVGALLAFYGLGIIIGSIGFGYAVTTNKISKRIGMISSLLATGAAIVLFALSKSLWMLALARLFQGLASCGVFVLGMAYIADIYDGDSQNMGLVMSFIFSGLPLGQMVGPPVSGALYAVGPQYPFVFSGILVAFDFACRFMIVDKLQPSKATVHSDDSRSDITGNSPIEVVITKCTPASSTSSVYSSSDALVKKAGAFAIADVLKMKQLMVVSLLCFFIADILTEVEPTLPLYLNSLYGYNSAQIGAEFLAFVLPNIGGGYVGGWIYDHYGIKTASLLGLSGTAVSIGLLAIPNIVQIAWTSFCLAFFGFAAGIAFAPIAPAIASSVPKEHYTLGYVLMNIVYSFAILVSPIAASYLYDDFGWMWQQLAFAFVAVITLPVAYFMLEENKPESEKSASAL